jgi:hypothetical protein
MMKSPEDDEPASRVSDIQATEKEEREDQPDEIELPVVGSYFAPIGHNLPAQEEKDDANKDDLDRQTQRFF